MSNSAKNAKSIGLSVAGILVALPADADLASITWVERAIQNQTPIPAGSVITGYASGSYGSYLLAGSTVGGPYSGVSISDIGSQMSPYISGDAIPFGFAPTGAAPTWLLGKGTNEDGAGGAWLNISNVAATIADNLSGSQISFPEKTIPGGGYVLANENSSGSGAAWTPVTTLGERINFASGGGSMILAGDGGSGFAGWMAASNLAQYIPGSQITGYRYWAFEYPALWNGSLRSGHILPSDFILAAPTSGGPFASVPLVAALTSTGVITVLTSGIFTQNGSPVAVGSYIGGYQRGSGTINWILGSTVVSGIPQYLSVQGLGQNLAGFVANNDVFQPEYILSAGSNNRYETAQWSKASALSKFIIGTAIGTVNGSQVKIEQTATAAELQAKTGTIYFPVVQDGKIYGVTLNDFYILMNAQF